MQFAKCVERLRVGMQIESVGMVGLVMLFGSSEHIFIETHSIYRVRCRVRLSFCFCLPIAAWLDHARLRSGHQTAVVTQNSNASGTKVTLADPTSERFRTSNYG